MTKNFSGAEIEGLIRNTWSFALDRQVDKNDLSLPIDEDNLKVRKQSVCVITHAELADADSVRAHLMKASSG